MNSDLINIQDQVFQGPKDKIYLIHREGKESRDKSVHRLKPEILLSF